MKLYKQNGKTDKTTELLRKIASEKAELKAVAATGLDKNYLQDICELVEIYLKDCSFQETVSSIADLVTFVSKEEVEQSILSSVKSNLLLNSIQTRIVDEYGIPKASLNPLDYVNLLFVEIKIVHFGDCPQSVLF